MKLFFQGNGHQRRVLRDKMILITILEMSTRISEINIYWIGNGRLDMKNMKIANLKA